jgi:catabolite repression HPr-like protein
MIKKAIVVKRSMDNHPIAHMVQEASRYSSQVHIELENKTINAKSIMGMMTLNLQRGDALTVVADGTDEELAAIGIETFLTAC